jgi:hypothetical protein
MKRQKLSSINDNILIDATIIDQVKDLISLVQKKNNKTDTHYTFFGLYEIFGGKGYNAFTAHDVIISIAGNVLRDSFTIKDDILQKSDKDIKIQYLTYYIDKPSQISSKELRAISMIKEVIDITIEPNKNVGVKMIICCVEDNKDKSVAIEKKQLTLFTDDSFSDEVEEHVQHIIKKISKVFKISDRTQICNIARPKTKGITLLYDGYVDIYGPVNRYQIDILLNDSCYNEFSFTESSLTGTIRFQFKLVSVKLDVNFS